MKVTSRWAWDRMEHPTRVVALTILNDADANKLARDIARVVLSDNGSRRLPCEERYDEKVVACDLMADLLEAVFRHPRHPDPEWPLLAKWWIEHVSTPRVGGGVPI